jgi:hypothetical protein
VHEAFGGHQATCEQNCGMEYDNLKPCFSQMKKSNPHLRMTKSYGQIQQIGLELISLENKINENKTCTDVNSKY